MTSTLQLSLELCNHNIIMVLNCVQTVQTCSHSLRTYMYLHVHVHVPVCGRDRGAEVILYVHDKRVRSIVGGDHLEGGSNLGDWPWLDGCKNGGEHTTLYNECNKLVLALALDPRRIVRTKDHYNCSVGEICCSHKPKCTIQARRIVPNNISVSPSIPESGWATRFDFGLIR